MKRFSNLISSLLVILSFIGLTACTDDVNNSHGEGCLSMKMNIAMPQSGTPMQQLKQDDANALADSCRVRIYGSNGLVRYYKGMNNVPSELWLAAGDYRVAVQTGDSVRLVSIWVSIRAKPTLLSKPVVQLQPHSPAR